MLSNQQNYLQRCANMGYLPFTIYECSSIEILRKEDYSMRVIDKHLKRSVSTISHVFKCNMTEGAT